MADVTIRTRPNGPFIVTGPVRLVDSQGEEFNIEGRASVALCRCGHSSNKPFCDGSHRGCGFEADQRAA